MSVDVEDLLRILNAWGTGDGEYDLDGDLVVGVNDLLIVIGDWGPCD